MNKNEKNEKTQERRQKKKKTGEKKEEKKRDQRGKTSPLRDGPKNSWCRGKFPWSLFRKP